MAEIQSNVHSPAAKDDAAGAANEPKLISAISAYFMENYLLVKVGCQNRNKLFIVIFFNKFHTIGNLEA